MKKLYYEYEDGRYRYWKPRMFFGDVTELLPKEKTLLRG